jgi:hypothetical protein
MAERKVKENMRALPHKIEMRLAALVQLGDFDQNDVTHCRRTYWGARHDWHTILVDCYDRAVQRQGQH